jgi:hypothetical protein
MSMPEVTALTQEQAAAIADVSARHLRRLCLNGIGPDQDVNGQFDPARLGVWLRERKGDDRARLLKAQADQAELELAKMRGEVANLADVEAHWSGMITAFRARMLLLPPTIAPIAAAAGKTAEVQALAQKHVYEALTELASNGRPSSSN